jgi:hypothetical protein
VGRNWPEHFPKTKTDLMQFPSKKLNVEDFPFARVKYMPLTRKAGIFPLGSARRLEQIVGSEGLGLKARNLIAWAGASPTSAGQGSLLPKPKGR